MYNLVFGLDCRKEKDHENDCIRFQRKISKVFLNRRCLKLLTLVEVKFPRFNLVKLFVILQMLSAITQFASFNVCNEQH